VAHNPAIPYAGMPMSHRRTLILVMLAAVVCIRVEPPALGDMVAPTTPTATNSGTADDSAVQTQLSTLLGPTKRLRDFAPFTTERGESAFLVLFVTDSIEPTKNTDLSQAMSCSGDVEGIGLSGTYHVGLVLGAKLINDVAVPCNAGGMICGHPMELSFPLWNTRYANYEYWGQRGPIAFDAPSAKIVEPTKLITLADFNGDGHAWEFRLVQWGGACGYIDSLVAGYSPTQRRAILYPIIMGKELRYWHANFFPPVDQPNAETVDYDVPCGDHGGELQDDQRFEYNAALEAWVMTREDHHLCTGSERMQPIPTSVQVHVGSAHGHPGETVTLAVTVDPVGADVEGVELRLPLGVDFKVKRCTAARASELSDVRTSSWGIDAISMGLGCGVTGEPSDCAPVANGTSLYTCEVEIDPYADPGAHTLSPSGVLVSDGWDRLHATVTDGEILVEDGATPTPKR
jgi:hypothetical protein